MTKAIKKGIILMNLGSPDSTAVKDVRRYLLEFLDDKRVIDYPYLLRKLLVGGIIVPFRAPNSSRAYQSVWTPEGSPLIVITKQLQAAVQERVEEPVEIAMRYGLPSIAGAYEHLMKKVPRLEEVLAIPLYPHYAMSSYETAVVHAQEVHKRNKYPFSLRFVKPFYSDTDYIHALSERIRPFLQQDYDQILFSYHGIPERHIRKSDVTGTHCLKSENCCELASVAHANCYRHQCITTTRLVAAELGISPAKYRHSFQSRLGREEWLKPYTANRLKELPGEGIKKLLIVCPAFVSDCLETLQEIGIEGRHSFMESGGETLTLVPCLNADRLWVETLEKWIRKDAGSPA